MVLGAQEDEEREESGCEEEEGREDEDEDSGSEESLADSDSDPEEKGACSPPPVTALKSPLTTEHSLIGGAGTRRKRYSMSKDKAATRE